MKSSEESDNAETSSNMDAAVIKNRHWAPNSAIIQMIEKHCETNEYSKVLEIGPGDVPFKLASDFIGCNERITNYIEIDIDKTAFPHADNSFDFIYCRHVLEDIQNPDFALNEMFRVSKFGGYIETPSPLIEATKNVDANPVSDKYDANKKPTIVMYKNGVNFGQNSNMIKEYIQLVVRAINESIQKTDYFIQTYK